MGDNRHQDRERAALTIGLALGLTKDEARALGLTAAWENETPEQFCGLAIRSRLDGSFNDMGSFANKRDPQIENADAQEAWAAEFYPDVKALLAKGSGKGGLCLRRAGWARLAIRK